MNRISVLFMVFMVGIAQPAHTHAALSSRVYIPAIIFGIGAATSTTAAFWANYQIRKLTHLPYPAESSDAIEKKLVWWKTVRKKAYQAAAILMNGAIIMAFGAAALRKIQKNYEQSQKSRGQGNTGDTHGTAENPLIQAARERARQQIAAERTRPERNGFAPARNEQTVPAETKEQMLRYAQNGDLASLQNLIDQTHGDARQVLLNACIDDRTAWYYAHNRGDHAMLAYALEYAAHFAAHRCGICLEQINDPAQYGVGSPSFNCLHFVCTDCLAQNRENFYVCPICRRN